MKNNTGYTQDVVECVFAAEKTPPPPAPAPHRCTSAEEKSGDVEAAIKDIRLTLQRTKTLPLKCHAEAECEENQASPVWIPRQRGASVDSERKVQSGEEAGDEGEMRQMRITCEIHNCTVHAEEADTDLETDRLLGQQRTDDQGFYDDKVSVCVNCWVPDRWEKVLVS